MLKEIKVLWIIALILILLSGFKIKINNYSFEWVGILEQILNTIK